MVALYETLYYKPDKDLSITRLKYTSVKTTSKELHNKRDHIRLRDTAVKTTSTDLHRTRDHTRFKSTSVKTTSTDVYSKRGRPGNTIPVDWSFIGNKWRLSSICKPYTMFINRKDFPLYKYATNAGSVKIFTHSLSDGISSVIRRAGAVELNTINRVLYQLKQDPNINLIDIGTNVGQHSIAAALIGRNSIAIDAVKSNIEHVCASANYLNIGLRITLIHNILSDSSGTRELRYTAGNSDFGLNHVDTDGIWDKMKRKFSGRHFKTKTVQENSATLDSLLFIPQIQKFKKVFIKIAVEGHEHRVCLGAKEFFKRLDVQGIIMEWAWHVKRQSSEIIKNLMTEWKFKPFRIFRTTQFDLSAIQSNLWPQDVLWLPIKNNTKVKY
ncbi:Hypothetical predicted protein [Mytilus galloprovincialis]|uniref:Methyltransferase FkbM domain-containing protein n=1 Tax=Mytilus galloprovincialis TaxID=29158 RepID=A0A8B6CVE4_MYTGA|nr:Hypothetical predicted protein [Mytilus galloprovincialis]